MESSPATEIWEGQRERCFSSQPFFCPDKREERWTVGDREKGKGRGSKRELECVCGRDASLHSPVALLLTSLNVPCFCHPRCLSFN